jgi:hypothetical protein
MYKRICFNKMIPARVRLGIGLRSHQSRHHHSRLHHLLLLPPSASCNNSINTRLSGRQNSKWISGACVWPHKSTGISGACVRPHAHAQTEPMLGTPSAMQGTLSLRTWSIGMLYIFQTCCVICIQSLWVVTPPDHANASLMWHMSKCFEVLKSKHSVCTYKRAGA